MNNIAYASKANSPRKTRDRQNNNSERGVRSQEERNVVTVRRRVPNKA